MTHHRSYEPAQTNVQTRDGILFFIIAVVLVGLTGAMSYRVGRDQQQADDQFAVAKQQQSVETERSVVPVIQSSVPVPVSVSEQLSTSQAAEIIRLKAEVVSLMRDRWVLKQKAAWMEPYFNCEGDRCLAVVEVKDK